MTTTWPVVDVEPAVTESPAAMETDATVPVMVLTRLAPATACWASVRLAWAVSTEAWSRATCWGVAFLADWPPVPPDSPAPPDVDDVDDADDVPVDAAGVVVPDADAPEPEPPVELEVDSRAVVRARSSCATCL